MVDTPEGELTPYMRGVIAGLEAEGVEAVRLRIQAGLLAPALTSVTLDWVAAKDRAAAAERAAIETASGNTGRAVFWITTAGLVVSVAGLAWTVFAWLRPHP